nr:trypsin-like serine protease [uncultured Desulfuromonas sp.]
MVVARDLNYLYHQTPVATGYDGVVRLVSNGFYGTGALLYSGNAILTAAHLFMDDDGNLSDDAVTYFETSDGKTSLTSTNYRIHPDYDPVDGNNDLAIVFLPEMADVSADRYQIYRESDEAGQQAILVGYGRSGTGLTGYDPSSVPERYKALNTLDISAGEFLDALGRSLAWVPDGDSLLLADFDSGSVTNDIIGHMTGLSDLGTGIYEGLIAPGDSGGPAFIDGRIAGVSNYTVRLEGSYESADVDNELNSSFGEMAFWFRVSSEQQWIDQTVRASYPDAPQSPEEVIKQVEEGNDGTCLFYFLVQFHGERDSVDQVLSIDYATRNGSALAAEDYLPVSGTLNLYPDETQAVIAVEVIGDSVVEDDETFYLDIFNPQGGTFAGGVDTLSAMRTILNDDGWA